MNHYPQSEGERLLARLPAAELPSAVSQLEVFLAQLQLDPFPPSERLIRLKERYEQCLNLLESEFLFAIESGDWAKFNEFVKDFRVHDQE